MKKNLDNSENLLLDINTSNTSKSDENNILLSSKITPFSIINPTTNNNTTNHNRNRNINRPDDRIICFSRRRKCPDVEDLCGYITTMFFFIIFSIVTPICLYFCKEIPDSASYISPFYDTLIFLIIFTSVISMIVLTDAASADPGRQRGVPISKKKFDSAKIKKFVGGEKFVLKYCTTCHLIRDIRTFHCSTCGLCIEKHDHHCNYLSNCVGVYNYPKFFLFLIVACIHVTAILISCLHIIFNNVGGDMEGYSWITIFIGITFMFAGFFEIFTVWMIVQHIVTIVQNRTTREFIKNKEYGIYNKGCKENCKEALCSNTVREF